MLEASETACDDTHKFNPSRFDMENAMRINLKKDCEPQKEHKSTVVFFFIEVLRQ